MPAVLDVWLSPVTPGYSPPASLPSHHPGPQPPLCFPEGMVPTAMLALHPRPHPALSCSGRCVLPAFLFHPSSPTSTSQVSTCPYTLQPTSTATLGTSVCQALSWEGPVPGERPHSLRPPSNRGSHLQVSLSTPLRWGCPHPQAPGQSSHLCSPTAADFTPGCSHHSLHCLSCWVGPHSPCG